MVQEAHRGAVGGWAVCFTRNVEGSGVKTDKEIDTENGEFLPGSIQYNIYVRLGDILKAIQVPQDMTSKIDTSWLCRAVGCSEDHGPKI